MVIIMTIFCPKCGRKLKSQSELILSVCPNCYLDEHPLTTTIDEEIMICSRCGALYYAHKWHYSDVPITEEIKNYVTEKQRQKQEHDEIKYDFKVNTVTIEDVSGNEGLFRIMITFFDFPYDSLLIDKKVESLEIPFKYTICDRCSKQITGYYESTVRIKQGGRKLSVETKRLIKQEIQQFLNSKIKNPQDFITRYTEHEKYIEFQMGSKNLARALATHFKKRYNAAIDVSAKLHGRSSGKTQYRTSVSIDLPRFNKGTIGTFRNREGLYLIEKVDSSRVHLFELTSKRKLVVSQKEFQSFEEMDASAFIDFQVLSVSPNDIQLLNLQNYEIYNVSPSEIPFHVETNMIIKGIIFNNVLIILPIISQKTNLTSSHK